MNSSVKSKTFSLKYMKNTKASSIPTAVQKAYLLLALGFALPTATMAADTAKSFGTPEEAVAALRAATFTLDTNAIRVIFGPAVEDLQNADRVQATNDLNKFSAALIATNHLVHVSDTNVVLEVGDDLWPFPIPLIKQDGQWHFDTDAGREEIINRRIGRNELDVLSVMRAYVDAQREYASKDRDGDEVLEYSQRISSSPGKMDGLYWPTELNDEMSPLGPMVAQAQSEGYFPKEGSSEAAPEPFHGYYFKILTRQGKNAPGGKYDYVINGNMIGGFAMVAWPADYGDSGVMTFIVNQQGRVYQKDLGDATLEIVAKMNTYDPDSTWKVSRE